jgi:hypothetical protein
MTRKEALITAINIDHSEVEELDKFNFETEGGEYLVITEAEAKNLTYDNIKNLFDDIGLESFTKNFQTEIKNNYIDQDWFKNYYIEYYYEYAEEIKEEAAEDDKFDNRLEEEMSEKGVDNIDDFVEHLTKQIDNYVEEFRFNLGDQCLVNVIKENPSLLDLDAIVEKMISLDGYGHFLATYDGEMLEEGDYLIFRTN